MKTAHCRFGAAALLFPVLLLSGCLWSTRKLPVPKEPAVVQTVTPDALAALLNQRWDAMESLTATVEIQASVLKPKEGLARDYTSIRGIILIRKPQMLRVYGRVPVIGTRAFDMVSDGKDFTLWIPSKNVAYEGSNTLEKKSANPLENLRPGFFLDALVVRGLHLPAGTVGSSGGPYFCLSDLARHWPSNDNGARHEVLLITDGVDTYEPRYDPADPYVEAAMNDSIRAGLVVYSIYWTDRGRYDNTAAGADAGQNLLAALTQTTGGYNYWTGNGNPVSFAPFFEDLSWRLQNQYRLSVDGRLRDKPAVETLNLKVGGPAAKVYAPQRVFVTASGGAGE